MRFACLFMPDFVLQANLRNEPGALSRPYALVDGAYPRVLEATRKALDCGVSLGMTRSQAAQLSEVRQRSAAQEESAQAMLLDCARSCSPRVEDTAAGTVVMDLEGLERFPPSEIAARLMERAHEAAVTVHVAFASNADTSILAARGFADVTIIPRGEEARKLAELPVTILNAQPETLATLNRWGVKRLRDLAALPPLPLSERLGQEGVHLQALARGAYSRPLISCPEAGRFEERWELEDPVQTLDELDFVLSSLLTRISKRLSMRSLAAQEMRLRLDLAQDIEPEPSLALEEQSRERGTQPRFSSAEAVTGHEQAAELENNSAPRTSLYERALSFPLPINNAQLFFKLWRLRLESDLPRQPVTKVEIAASPARPRAIQGGLFTPLAPDPEKLELVLARIAAVVGSGNVGSPELMDTHRPHAFRMARFTGIVCMPANSQRGKEAAAICAPKRIPNGDLPMALRLFRPPVPARVELRDGIPAKIFSAAKAAGRRSRESERTASKRNGIPAFAGMTNFAGMTKSPSFGAQPDESSALRFHGMVVSASGPWKRSGGWWEDGAWDREEWDVEIRSGPSTRLCLLCHDLAEDAWTVQGEYD